MWVTWLFALLLGVVARDHEPLPPLKRNRSPHHSKVARSHRNGRFHMKFSMSQNKEVDLELEPNNELLSSDYEEHEILSDGSSVVVRKRGQFPLCWFRGKIVGDENSDVIVSDCDGFEGLIRTGDGKSHIARAGETNDDVSVYDLEDEEENHGSCGVPHHGHPATSHSHLEEQKQVLPTIPPAGRRLLVTNTSENVVEVALVSDNGYLRARGGPYGRNLTAVAQLNVQIMNIVRATYMNTPFAKPTSVQLKAQFFFSGQDPYPITKDENGEVDQNTLLNSFNTWMKTNLPNRAHFDHAHLLTYYDLLEDTVGFAFTESICNIESFSAVSEAANTVLRVANTVAHELGHVLGMGHDQAPSCPDANGYVMAATNSCPTTGLCPFSACSILTKNDFASEKPCLSTWNESTCSDGELNGLETDIDCGGPVCPACTATGCDDNNGGCEQTCVPLGTTGFVCACNSSTYVDPSDGVSCVEDIDQCALPTSPCDENCTNILAPGGVYKSFECSCNLDDNVLSAVNGVTCAPPSCFDGVKNQDEVMVDCGGVCFPYCGCLVSSVNWPTYAYDRGFSLNNAQWRSRKHNHYELIKFGVPIRYVYKTNSTAGSEWVYDSDSEPSTGYFGILRGSPNAPSGVWKIYDGSNFADHDITFRPCSLVTGPTCGNGILEGGEMCESCLVYSGGVCVTPNPCCDSTCQAPRPRGLSCKDRHDLQGACWDGECITRDSSCAVITTANCFGNLLNCAVATGGQECGAVEGPFTSTSCGAPIKCYIDCLGTTLDNTNDPIGATRGFPCSAVDADGAYPSVCSGGPTGNGKGGSECLPVDVLSSQLHSNFSKSPTSSPSPPGPTPPVEALSGAGSFVVGVSILLVLLSPCPM